MSLVDPKPDEENEACPKSKPQKPRPKRNPKSPTGHLPPLDQIQEEEETPQPPKRLTRRCAKCGERALAETVRKGRCIGCQVEAYLDTL